MEWNDDQKKAIELRGSDILVSAGAGSGKTAVLVERIARRILPENGEEPLDLDRLLVVTYTKAAAAEMRQRLFEILRKRMEKASSDDEYRRIYTQQKKISKAKISTIHSFCHSIINEFAAESGIDSSYRLMSDALPEKLMSDAADEVLENLSKNERDKYLRLTDIFGGWKGDGNLKKTIINIARFADNFEDPISKIEEFRSAYDSLPNGDFAATAWGKYVISYVSMRFSDIINVYSGIIKETSELGIVKYYDALIKESSILENILSVLQNNNSSWNDILKLTSAISFPDFPGRTKKDTLLEEMGEIKEKRDNYIKEIKSIISDFLSYRQEDLEEELSNIRPIVYDVTDAAIDLIKRYSNVKKKRKLMDFSDLEHIALKLLQNDKIAEKYRDKLDEVYIDEYQDTNEVQNKILKIVSSNNRFMVGDVKQSIYQFRQARPDLFMDKYQRYGEGKDGQLVRLNANYRCRSQVIDFTNRVFCKIMNKNTAGMDYGENEKLVCGAAPEYMPAENPALDYNCEVICALGKNADDARNIEYNTIAGKIKYLVENGLVVGKTTAESDDRRKVTYGDICILLRSGTNIKELTNAMQKYGIPYVSDKSASLFVFPEVMVIMSFLRILDNPMQDIHLISVLKNIYGFSDDLLSEIRLSAGRNTDFYTAVLDSASKPCIDFINRLFSIRDKIPTSTVSEIIWNCMHENGFFERLSQIYGGENAKQNLMQLFGMASGFDERDKKGLSGFIEYTDIFTETKKDKKIIPAKASDSVRIMTMHGSKGLEFPVVFIAGTGGKRNDIDEKDSFICNRSLGFGTVYYDDEKKLKYPSFMRKMIARKIKEESKAEEMRILYVAMTRAREKLIITGHVDKGLSDDEYKKQIGSMTDDGGNVYNYFINKAEHFIDLICAAVINDQDENGKITFASAAENDTDQKASDDKIFATLPKMPLYEQTAGDNYITFGLADDSLPSKIAVTEIKRLGYSSDSEDIPVCTVKPEDISLETLSQTDKKITAARKGTLIHLAAQHMDYSKIDVPGYADELIVTLIDNGYVTKDEAQYIPADILSEYMKSGFAKRIAKADKLLREVPFTITDSYREFGIDKDGNVTVQGIIDCVFFENGRIILVDFKSDSVYDNYADYSARYKYQLAIYAKAVKRAFGREPDEIYLYYIRSNHPEEITF